MRIAREHVIYHLEDRGADEATTTRAFDSLPALVETNDYEQTLRELGVDIDALTSAAGVEGPEPDDLSPETEGPVGAPNRAGGSS